MTSYNEWGRLKKVIVGIADDARIPTLDVSLRVVNYANVHDETEIKNGLYPKQVIDEANEDLEILCDFLRKENVEVLRPDKKYVPNYYNYCPRDTCTIYGDLAIAAPMSLQCRDKEYFAYMSHLNRIVEIPNYLNDDIYNEACIGNPNILALKETHPKFDAANIIRANDEWLYLVSNSGNKIGAKYLEEALGGQVKVRLLENIYSYMHIDSTVAFLREGLLLANSKRITTKDQLPPPFNSWDIIWAPEPVDIGFYPGYCNSSPWVNVNLLSVDENLVILEEHQHNLRIMLEAYGIECAMLPMRHARTLGGCFHCVTLDLDRS